MNRGGEGDTREGRARGPGLCVGTGEAPTHTGVGVVGVCGGEKLSALRWSSRREQAGRCGAGPHTASRLNFPSPDTRLM